MSVCRGCLRNLAGIGATPGSPRLLHPLRKTPSVLVIRRAYVANNAQADVRSALANPGEPSNRRTSPKTAKVRHQEPLQIDNELVEYEHSQALAGNEVGKRQYERRLHATVRKHLEHYTDPYHIAQYVSRVLEKGSFDEALMMARLASRDKKVEVSWNHLIDYQMKNRRLHAAVKLYNEMKKRGQIPNAKTYTVIFRGCAGSLHPKLAVSEATRIYNFMVKHATLKPNTIHMNAVLEVCARARDIESLFTVLSTANTGIRTPDSCTYTIVLNALRHEAVDAKKLGTDPVDSEIQREIHKNILRARAIWADVISQWRSAKTVIDADLVYAMARLLTEGDYKDNESILDLLWQTMKIPRLDQVSGHLQATPDAQITQGDNAEVKADPNTSANQSATVGEGLDTKDMSPRERAQAVLARAQTTNTPLFAKPDSKALAIVLHALANTRKTSHAAKYWDYFTRTLGVTPDAQTYFAYQRALGVGHASAQMAALVKAMPRDIVTAITIRRALRACVDDNLNPDAFKHAYRIFDIMLTRLRYPDPLSMRLFLQAARANTRHFLENQDNEKRAALGKQLVSAVTRLWEPLRLLTGSLSYPNVATKSPEELLEMQRGDMQEAMAVARRTIAAIDKIVFEGLADRPTTKVMQARRIILQRLVERYIAKLYPHGEPKEVGAPNVQALEDVARTALPPVDGEEEVRPWTEGELLAEYVGDSKPRAFEHVPMRPSTPSRSIPTRRTA